ncbi:hypothetical protein [Aeromonas jandaei]|uniref:hypothetical protein n=1 Tax=Aeromonas jandaei TaxID=650 RepID=UPI003B9E17DC
MNGVTNLFNIIVLVTYPNTTNLRGDSLGYLLKKALNIFFLTKAVITFDGKRTIKTPDIALDKKDVRLLNDSGKQNMHTEVNVTIYINKDDTIVDTASFFELSSTIFPMRTWYFSGSSLFISSNLKRLLLSTSGMGS